MYSSSKFIAISTGSLTINSARRFALFISVCGGSPLYFFCLGIADNDDDAEHGNKV